MSIYPASRLLSGLFLSVSMVGAGSALAGQEAVVPSCRNAVGEVVHYTAAPHEVFVERRKHLGFSGRNPQTNEPTIVFDGDEFSALSEDFQRFVHIHECEHHRNGDVDTIGIKDPAERDRREKIADCGAIIRMRDEFSLSEGRMTALADDVGNSMLQIGASMAVVQPRIKTMYQCYDGKLAANTIQ